MNRLPRIAASLDIEVDEDLSERIADHQLEIVWSHVTVGVAIATVFAVFLAFQFRTAIPDAYVKAWLVLKLAVALPRLIQARLYKVKGHPGGPSWRAWTYGLLAIDGFVWGLAGLIVSYDDMLHAAILTASMACIASVATFGLQVRMLATAAYIGPMIGLTAIALLARQDEFGAYAGIGLLMYLALLLTTAYRSERAMFETFLLREHSARIAGERQRALELAQTNAAERELALQLATRESAAKTQFLATMSHEFRTPLHGILGIARLLKSEFGDASLRRRIGLIESSGEHLLGLINDLLDVTRIESGHANLQQVEFNLREELEKVAEVYALRAAEKQLRFDASLNISNECWVVGDSARLRQVLHNLLGNALKFTERGQISLDVSHGDGDSIVFEVRDSGIGISEEFQSRIFEKFSQAEAPGRSPLEGTGLGLTIARELARAMGGDITCTSTRAVGSCFRFHARLPPAPPRARAPQPESSAVAPQARPPREASPLVLVAEDNEVNALVARAYLERERVSVEVVDNGGDAVERCLHRDRRPDMVLMDIRMPIVDGLSATKMIRAEEAKLGLPRLPIVALTATSSSEDRARCIEAGMDDCLPKPFRENELVLMLEKWLRQVRPSAENEADCPAL